MNEKGSDRAREIFEESLQRPADERSTFLREACADDRDVQVGAEALLTRHAETATQVTVFLQRAAEGDREALERLWSLVYGELKALARNKLAYENAAQALQPTALVNEVYLRLTGGTAVQWANRRHFFHAAGKAMQRILIDHWRARNALRRGGGRPREPLNEAALGEEPDLVEAMAISEVLLRLEAIDERKAEIVRLRYLVGLTIDETAKALAISPRLVRSEWTFAKAWLHRELSEGDTEVRRPDTL
jgi:RNA polymerase sigma factor (TIGR02999 family)